MLKCTAGIQSASTAIGKLGKNMMSYDVIWKSGVARFALWLPIILDFLLFLFTIYIMKYAGGFN